MSNIGFLLIGAPKAGTSSLFEYFRQHPQIYMPPEKESYFFNVDRSYARGWDWYSSTITRGAPLNAICGEATPEYMSGAPLGNTADNVAARYHEPLEEVVPRRIKRLLPDVRLLCVLRDPVERAYSHHQMMVLGEDEPRSFGEAIHQLMQPEALEQARIAPTRNNSYIVYGEYCRILSGFWRVFPREQLMVIFTKDLAERPAVILSNIFEFIGVAPDFEPNNLNTRYRSAAVKPRIVGLNLYNWQASLARVSPARTLWHALPGPMRNRVDRAYSVANYHIGMWNARRDVVSQDIPLTVRRRLIEHFLPDSHALADAINIEVPWLPSWEWTQ
jgi:hypothetical protein